MKITQYVKLFSKPIILCIIFCIYPLIGVITPLVSDNYFKCILKIAEVTGMVFFCDFAPIFGFSENI